MLAKWQGLLLSRSFSQNWTRWCWIHLHLHLAYFAAVGLARQRLHQSHSRCHGESSGRGASCYSAQ
jgi:hypothetical protein